MSSKLELEEKLNIMERSFNVCQRKLEQVKNVIN